MSKRTLFQRKFQANDKVMYCGKQYRVTSDSPIYDNSKHAFYALHRGSIVIDGRSDRMAKCGGKGGKKGGKGGK